MSNKSNKMKSFNTVIIHVFLTAGCFLTLLPIFWMITGGFKTRAEIVKIPMVIFPEKLSFNNFVEVFKHAPFGIYYLNSIIITVMSTISIIITSTAAGYSLSKFNFKGKNLIFLLFISSMMVPFHIRMIPLYNMTLDLNLMNKLWGVIYIALMDSFGVFLMRQFIMDIPNAYIESGRIEGAHEIKILTHIIIPMCKPALSALAILMFIWNWEWYLWPVIILTSSEKYTLPIGLATFSGRYLTQYNLQMAAATLVTLPVVILFLVFQRQFVEGVVFTGIKG